MKYLNLKMPLALLAFVAFTFSACKKVKTPEPMGDAGQTLLKIIGGGTPAGISKNPIDFVPIPKTIVAADIRRNAPNSGELNRVMHVTVKDDIALVAANPAYTLLPSNWYTIGSSTPKTGGSGGNYSITMQPGDFAEQIFITIPDATVFDPASVYALAFTITTADAAGIITEEKSIIVEVNAKNIVHEDLLWDFQRWNIATQSVGVPAGAPNGGTWVDQPETLTTIAANQNEIHSGYFIQPRYRLTFDDVGGVATNFTVVMNPNDVIDFNNQGITWVEGPNLLIASFGTKRYKMQYQVFNGAAYRYIIDEYHK